MSIGLVLRDQNKNEQGYWINFPVVEGVSFKIRPVSFFEENRIKEKVKKEVLTKKDGGVELTSYEDNDSFLIEKVDFALVDWKGIGTSPKDVAECDRKNKISLISQNKSAFLFILNAADNIDLYLTEKLKQEKKS